MTAFAFTATAVAAENDSQPNAQQSWHVSRFSGDVWLVAPGAQRASLSQEAALSPGDTIRTGPNGRVLLTRGAESMMVAPNSVVGLPSEGKDGMSTTIAQQAGSILLDVEKRNVQHFAVETPYLAAVVKGTQFRVTVTPSGANVAVSRGQVEVADFRSGQIAQVLPGQTAKVSASGQTGLSLSGSGTFRPIEPGQPRAPVIDKVMVPRGGFNAPRTADGVQVKNLNAFGHGHGDAKPAASMLTKLDGDTTNRARGAVRISAPLGDVKLNFSKVTHGLAHGAVPTSVSARTNGNKDTIWNSNASASNTSSNAGGNSAAVTAVTTSSAAPAAAIVASSNSATANVINQPAASNNPGGNGNGNSDANGNNGNGNGNKSSDNGNGNGNGHGNGNGRGHKS
jgi:hypothetical protein